MTDNPFDDPGLRDAIDRLDRYRFDFYAMSAKTFCDNMRIISKALGRWEEASERPAPAREASATAPTQGPERDSAKHSPGGLDKK